MELFKRLFAGVTIVAMALITVAPTGFAHAATLEGGDLVKASGAAVYYYGTDGKRYVFPNEATYKTWYADFSKVKTITDSELAALPIGGNVVFRAGTNLVKITTDPKVYAVAPNGALHWVKSEAAAKTLWGNDWAKWVKDVPDAFFTNYSVSTTDLDGTMHVPGSVIKYSGSDKMYYVDTDGKKREFTGTAFADNGFMSKFVVTSPDSITYPNGSGIGTKEAMFWDAAQKSTTGQTTTPVTGNGTLTVAIAADTPAAADIPSGETGSDKHGATDIPFTKLNLTASGDDVKITEMKIMRAGLSSNSDLGNAYLVKADGSQVGSSQTFDANNQARFTGLNLTIPAGQTMALWVKGDSETATETSPTGGKTGRIKLGVASASDVMSNAKTVSGSFPMYGNTMTQVAVNVGKLTVAKGALDPTATTVDIDEKQKRFIQVKLTGSGEDIDLYSIGFRQGDDNTVSADDLENYSLYNDDTNTKIGTANMVDDKVMFMFNPPMEIKEGKKLNLSLKADVVGGSGKKVTFALVNTDGDKYFLHAVGKEKKFGVHYSSNAATGTDFGDGTATASETEQVTVSAGTLTISKGTNAKPAGNIPTGGDEVELGSFDFEVKGEDVKIGQIKTTITNGTDVTNYKLMDKDGNVLAGPYDVSGGVVTFSTEVHLPVGTNELFLKADIGTSASGAISAAITPSSQITKVKGKTSNKTISMSTQTSAISTNGQTVQAAAVSLTMTGSPIAGDKVENGKDVFLAETFCDPSAGGEDVKMTSFTIADGAGTSGAIMGDFSNFKLWDGSTQIGETEQPASASSTSLTFDVPAGVICPKEGGKKLKITADPEGANITGGTDTSAWDITAGVGTGVKSGESATVTVPTPGATTDSPTIEWQDAGYLKVTLDPNTPVAQQIAAGSSDVEVVRYRLEGFWEDINVTEFNFFFGGAATASTSAAQSTGTGSEVTNIATSLAGVKVYLGSKLIGTPSVTTGGKAVLAVNDVTLTADEEYTLSVKIDLNSKNSVGSNTALYVGLSTDTTQDGTEWDTTPSAGQYYNIDATGVSSGDTITEANINSVGTSATGLVQPGKQMQIYDGVLTLSKNVANPVGLTQDKNTKLLVVDLHAEGDEVHVRDLEVVKSGSCVPGTGATPTDTTLEAGEYGAKWASVDENTTYWIWDAIKSGTANDIHLTKATAVSTTLFGMEASDAAYGYGTGGGHASSTTLTNDTSITATTQDLKVSAGESKTIAFFADTGSVTACSTDTTVKITLQANNLGTDSVTNGVIWTDQEMAAKTTPETVDSTLTTTLPIAGNLLEK